MPKHRESILLRAAMERTKVNTNSAEADAAVPEGILIVSVTASLSTALEGTKANANSGGAEGLGERRERLVDIIAEHRGVENEGQDEVAAVDAEALGEHPLGDDVDEHRDGEGEGELELRRSRCRSTGRRILMASCQTRYMNVRDRSSGREIALP